MLLLPQVANKSIKRSKRERGNSLVEGALVIGMFLMMLIAIIDFGQVLFVHATLTERVRNAVRLAVLDSSCDATCVQNLVLYRSKTVPDSNRSTDGIGLVNLTAANVVVTVPDDATTSTGSTLANRRLTVTLTNYQYVVVAPFIWHAGTAQMKPITATAPVESPYAS
jgi:Flp pilus assembly protein TadG